MKIIVTGTAGFIGAALALRLLKRGDIVTGIDNHNNYYDLQIKEDRVALLTPFENYTHIKADLADRNTIEKIFDKYQPNCVVNLAAQAGIRYSIKNPLAYIESNIVGFANILEGCRNFNIQHLVYASSSSIYGANKIIPFSVKHNGDHPMNLYAASKKSNELMAHAYSHLYKIPTTGLRFFTVYGPWGRPDMALHKFTRAIIAGEELQVYNFGMHLRDYTYIDDIVEGVLRSLDSPPTIHDVGKDHYSHEYVPSAIYNLGNSKPVELLTLISTLEEAIGKRAIIKLLPAQAGDMQDTYADIHEFVEKFDYRPITELKQGVLNFVEWYRNYYLK